MKNFICLLTVISIMFIFGGCASKRTLQTAKIITACSAYGNGEYTFFVAVPKGASEEGGSVTNHTSYTFTASNFADAVKKMRNSSCNIDLSHISVFLANNAYMSDKFFFDAAYIKQVLKISPLIKVFISENNPKDTVESLSSNYSGVNKYADEAYHGKKKNILCTMSELFFASVNSYYTASIPVITISPENNLPASHAIVFYNSNKGTFLIENEECETYVKAVASCGKSSNIFDLSYSDNSLKVTIDKTLNNREKVRILGEKCKFSGFDIFNSMYFSKKCFPTYSSYEKSIGSISVSDIIFE